jgi:lipoate-protein ligase A
VVGGVLEPRGSRTVASAEMAALDIIVVPLLGPWQLLGLESHLLEAVGRGETAPVLLIHAMPGRMVSLGRYHLYSGPAERGGIFGWRRLTGGRLVGSGEGWLGLALVLPSRTALLPESDARLKPEQVMNRYVRGLLAGSRLLGLDCFYPGRDAVTANRRELAMCSFETDLSGAMLFEAALAVNRGMEDVVHDLDRFDPDGLLTCPMYSSENATKVVRELGRDVAFDQLASAIACGYAESLAPINRRELAPIEIAQADHRGATLESSGWLNVVAPDPALGMASRIASQLGSVEARLELDAAGTIRRIQFSGDFIANSPAIRALESELTGRRLDLASVSAAVMKTFADGANFILGVGDLSNLVKLVTGAQ